MQKETAAAERQAQRMRLLRAVATHSTDASASTQSNAVTEVIQATQAAIKKASFLREMQDAIDKQLFTLDERCPKLPLDHRKVRFVMYVDDLDRCNNGKSVEILEAVQLLFNEVAPANVIAGSMTEFSGFERIEAYTWWFLRKNVGCVPWKFWDPRSVNTAESTSSADSNQSLSEQDAHRAQLYSVEREDFDLAERLNAEKPPFITVFMIDPRIVVQDIMLRFGKTLKHAGING